MGILQDSCIQIEQQDRAADLQRSKARLYNTAIVIQSVLSSELIDDLCLTFRHSLLTPPSVSFLFSDLRFDFKLINSEKETDLFLEGNSGYRNAQICDDKDLIKYVYSKSHEGRKQASTTASYADSSVFYEDSINLREYYIGQLLTTGKSIDDIFETVDLVIDRLNQESATKASNIVEASFTEWTFSEVLGWDKKYLDLDQSLETPF